MSERPTKWGYSHDQEMYSLCESREGAIVEAGGVDYGGFWVAELEAVDLRAAILSAIDVGGLLDVAREAIEVGPEADVEIEVTPEQGQDLTAMLTAVTTAWCEKYDIRWGDWYNTIPGTEERIEPPEDTEPTVVEGMLKEEVGKAVRLDVSPPDFFAWYFERHWDAHKSQSATLKRAAMKIEHAHAEWTSRHLSGVELVERLAKLLHAWDEPVEGKHCG